MPGRRKPTALKIAAGVPGHRPLPENEPKPDPAIPDMPSSLDRDGRREWRRVVPEMAKIGLLTNCDRAVLTAYCIAVGRQAYAERMIKKEGLVHVTKTGYCQKNPWIQISDKCSDQIRKLATELGLSPKARSQVAAVTPDDDDAGFFETR